MLTAALAALGAALSVAAWHTSAGVTLTPTEGASVAIGAALTAVCLAMAGWGAGLRPLAAALLPLAVLQGFYWLPITGKLKTHVDHTSVFVLFAVAVAMAFTLRSRFQRPAVGLLGVLVVGSAVAQRPRLVRGAPDRPVHPPIVLLTLDTLRADHLAGFGGDVDTAHTPNLDAFFGTARVFRNAYAGIALTEPSHTTMLTGLGVEQHRVTVNGQRIPEELPWVPEELQQAGWRTRAAVSASVLDASLGLSRGFEDFDSTFDNRVVRAYSFLNWGGIRTHAGSSESRPGAETVALIPDFPAGSFTWLHLYDAHWPYAPSPEAGAAVGLTDVTPLPETGVGRQMNPSEAHWPEAQVSRGKLLYRASLQDLDALVGSVLARIPEDASVIITGDHGESLDEHDYVFSHGRLPFAPDVHTPLAVRAPGLSPEWVDTPVSLSAIAQTIRALAGLPGPGGGAPADQGLLGPLPGTPVLSVAYAEGFFGAQKPHPLGPIAGIAIRQQGRTAAWTRWTDPAGYDPVADPRDLAPGPIAAPEQSALEKAAASAGHENAPEPDLIPALQALGYMDAAEPPPAAGK